MSEEMKEYIGTKIIKARPCTAKEVAEILGREIETKNADAEGNGYLVKYKDGYTSWSPAGVFEEVYEPYVGMAPGDDIDYYDIKQIKDRIEEIDEIMQEFRASESISQVELARLTIELQSQKNELTRFALSLLEHDNTTAILRFSGADSVCRSLSQEVPESEKQKPKTLHNSEQSGASKNVKDLNIVGDGDSFALLFKASSQSEGWMKSTKAMDVGHGCLVQVTTQQRNPDGSYAVTEALTFVPGVMVADDENDGRKLVPVD